MRRGAPQRRISIAIVVLALGVVGLCVYAFPSWIVVRSVGKATFKAMEADKRLKAENDVRATLLQALAGAAVLTGGLAAWRQLRVVREGQITDRYASAIEQLGQAKGAVRIGGIYALERIAKDSDVDRRTITEVLCAFVRQHARTRSLDGEVVEAKPLRADVQAALTVLGRLDRPRAKIDLSGTDLHGAELPQTSFDGAEFTGADLRQAYLREAKLRSARFYFAILTEADLQGADLQNAEFSSEAGGDGAHLEKADLRGADLQRAKLQGAHLEEARANKRTMWPEDFGKELARDAGVVFEE
jgi:hypothetical protein